MKKIFLLFAGLLFFVPFLVNAQTLDNTINAPGDIAFVAYNEGATGGEDGFSFLLIDSAPAGAVIVFTDEEWTGTEFSSPTGEGDVTWTNNTGAAIPGGTIIDIVNASDNPGSPITASIGVAVETDAGFNTAIGDQIYAFTGSRASPGVFLAFVGGLPAPATLSGTGLVVGETAAVFSDEGYYSGPTTFNGTAINCAATINSIAN